jgi:hypothetical protein
MHPLIQFTALHGRWGYWDELLNLVPVVAGAILLTYLYLSSRRRQRDEDAATDPEAPDDA